MRLYRSAICFLVFLLVATASAKERPVQVIVWPTSGTPVVRFTFGEFKQISTLAKAHNYTTDVIAENLWNRKISEAVFRLYLFDKDKVRIADAMLRISDVSPGGVVKFQTFVNATGTISSMQVVPVTLPSELQALLAPPGSIPIRLISITINSVPQGADLKLDGMDAGTTPKIVRVSPGKHVLAFSKEGFKPGTFPLEIAPDAASGGSVSYELGSTAHDTVELRDGSVVSGDIESVSATEVVVSVGGTLQRFERNQVKRIILIQRESPSQ
jgi:hypothetical protein